MKVKRLSDKALPPQKAHAGDLGYDLFSNEGVAVFPKRTSTTDTSITITIKQKTRRENI